MSSPPDLYATEEQRKKLIKQIGKSEAKIFKKRLACKDYCDKLLDHVQLMRKDLLCLDSNEDAIAIHEELKGITDCMDIFSFGLDQSVMNEPTQINLADWANLCLFRLAIVRRRLSTIKIYIDKTGSAEALYKIEAFLYYAYEFLNTGELDEYEGEMIKDDCFFNISFLLGHSSIADPLRSTAPENEEESEIVEPLKDSDSETESSSDEEMEPVKADDDASDELEVEPDVEPEVHVEGEESELGEGKENSAIGSVEEQVEIKDGETEEEKQDDEKEERDEKEDEKEGEEKETSKEIQESPAVEVSDEKVSGGEKEISNEATKEEDSGKTEEATDEKTEQSEKKEEKSEEAGGNKKISKKADKKKGNDKTASPDKESPSENKSRRGTTSGTMSPFKLRFGRKKKKDNQRDSVPTAAVLSTPQNPSKKNIKIGRMPRSPLVTKKKEAKKGRSLSAFSRKKIVMEPSLEPPMVSGQIFISAKGSGWKNQWGVLNSEKLEIYKDNECLHLVKTVPIGSFAHLSFVNPEEIAKDEKDEKKKKNISHVIILDYAAGTIHIGTDSRNDLLEWAIGICCIYRDTSKKNLIPNLNDLLVELYSKSYGDQTAIKREEEQWIFVGGLLTCVGKSIQYSWDGLSLQHLKGDDFGEVTWDGIYLTLKRKDKEDVVFHWVPCAHEFKSPSDPNGSSSIVWNWNKERLLQFLPICPDSEKPKMWKFLRPVAPPVAMSVEMFSLLYEGKEIIPEFDSPVGGSYIRERRNQRTKNKEEGVIEREKKGTKDKKKRKSRKRKSANSEDKISRKNKKKEGEEEKSVTEEKSTVEEKSVEETSGDENSADEKEKEKESNENKPDAPASETEKSAEEDGEQAAEAENAE